MLGRIMELLTMRLGTGLAPERAERRRQVATAALLFSVARADHVQDASEEAAMRSTLQLMLSLSDEDVEELLVLAVQELADSSSDYPFTRLINDTFSDREKSDLVREMWRIAFADGNLHKYEEHLIRKIATLIYLPHSEFIRTKLAVSEENRIAVQGTAAAEGV